MTLSQKIGLGVVLALIAFTGAFLGGKIASGNLGGGAYNALPTWFGNGFSGGDAEQLVVDKYGNATTSGSVAVTGATRLETLTEGGGIRATSTNDTTATFLASDFDVENMIEFTPTVTGITATLPATSTLLDFLPNASDSRSLMLCNATTTALAAFTLAFGTGMNAQKATSTLAIPSGDCATLDFVRATDTDIEVFYDLGF